MPKTPDKRVVEQIVADIMIMLEENDAGISFAILEKIPGFTGNFALIKKKANIVFWQGVSIEAIFAIAEMKTGGIIKPVPSSLLAYCTDGKFIRLPLAKSDDFELMKRGLREAYSSPHWLPVVFTKGHNYPKWVAA